MLFFFFLGILKALLNHRPEFPVYRNYVWRTLAKPLARLRFAFGYLTENKIGKIMESGIFVITENSKMLNKSYPAFQFPIRATLDSFFQSFSWRDISPRRVPANEVLIFPISKERLAISDNHQFHAGRHILSHQRKKGFWLHPSFINLRKPFKEQAE